MSNITIAPNYNLVSLDVVSLFTSIPVDLALNIIDSKWHLLEEHTGLEKGNFMQLLDHCLRNSYFIFEGKFYNQNQGLAMGNPLSPIIADIVMSELQNNCIEKLSFDLPFFKRYVDDIITMVPEGKEGETLNVFNSYNKNIQFTMEQQVDNSITFLDVKLVKLNNKIITDWHLKPTHSQRYLNFFSDHTMKLKINIIKNLFQRILKLSDPTFHNSNIVKAKLILRNNNYPIHLINSIINDVRSKESTNNNMTTHSPANQNNNNNKKYFVIPYIKHLSERIAKTLKTEEVEISFKYVNTVFKHFYNKLKFPTPTLQKSNLVYQIPCDNCPSVYIGQTSKYLSKRIKQHQYDVTSAPRFPNRNHTALVNHVIDNAHDFNFNNPQIKKVENNLKKRLLHEMIEIKSENNSINSRTDIEGLQQCYFNILKHSQ